MKMNRRFPLLFISTEELLNERRGHCVIIICIFSIRTERHHLMNKPWAKRRAIHHATRKETWGEKSQIAYMQLCMRNWMARNVAENRGDTEKNEVRPENQSSDQLLVLSGYVAFFFIFPSLFKSSIFTGFWNKSKKIKYRDIFSSSFKEEELNYMNCGAIHIYAPVNPKDRLLFSLCPLGAWFTSLRWKEIHAPATKHMLTPCRMCIYIDKTLYYKLSASFHSNPLIRRALVINSGAAHTNRQSYSTIEKKGKDFPGAAVLTAQRIFGRQ